MVRNPLYEGVPYDLIHFGFLTDVSKLFEKLLDFLEIVRLQNIFNFHKNAETPVRHPK